MFYLIYFRLLFGKVWAGHTVHWLCWPNLHCL